METRLLCHITLAKYQRSELAATVNFSSALSLFCISDDSRRWDSRLPAEATELADSFKAPQSFTLALK